MLESDQKKIMDDNIRTDLNEVVCVREMNRSG
jgi:hypothetical protein